MSGAWLGQPNKHRPLPSGLPRERPSILRRRHAEDEVALRRFKKTATGKLRARHANSSHILEKKSPKRKRGFRKDRVISKADEKTVTKLLGGNGR